MLSLAASFSVVDSHTAGHPTRVILSGIPALRGESVSEKRADFEARFDHLRPLLLHEPRGHAAMVGLVPLPSAVADHGAFFMSSYVYLDMCGHGTIGYAKTLAATGQIARDTDSFTLETPAGVVTIRLVWSAAGELAAVRLRNVPSYVGIEDLVVHLDGFDPIHLDIVYGGMWYALVDARALGLALVPDRVSDLLRIGSALKAKIKAALGAGAPFAGAAAPSVLFYADDGPGEATHLLILESNKFDRSPCGTGTAARVTQLARQGKIGPSGEYRARNILGVPFVARVAEERPTGALVVEIEGIAHITAFSTIVVEAEDPLSQGFLCR